MSDINLYKQHLFVVDSGHNAEKKMQVDGVNTACPEKQL